MDVRKALKREVLKQHERDVDTLVLHELGLRHGAARVDVAVVNGALHGYEIKSDADTLERLPAQIATYGLVLDKATLVVGERHAPKAVALLPDWWGVKIATQGPRGGISLHEEKRARTNPSIDPLAVAELLWSNEVRAILRELGFIEKELRKPRAHLYRELVAALELDELRDTTRRVLKGREKWRCQPQPA
ncbi:MAG: sce7726 family protein [Sphingopyxis sp.]|nr:sce7726 family protein [Sphingopyxis sp.]